MDAEGRNIDNIVIERFLRSLKYEDVYPSSYKTLKETREGIEKYMKTCNQKRLYFVLCYKYLMKFFVIKD